MSFLLLDKGDYLENTHAVFSNKQPYFEPFMCLDFSEETDFLINSLILNLLCGWIL